MRLLHIAASVVAASSLLAGSAEAMALPHASRAAVRKAQRQAALVGAQRMTGTLRIAARPRVLRREERIKFPVIDTPALRPQPSVPNIPAAPDLRAPSAPRPVIEVPPAHLSPLHTEVLRLLNREREKQGLVPLVAHGILQRSASLYAADMRDRKFFGHRNPEGQSSLDRIRAAGYLKDPCNCRWNYVTGENLASGQQTVQEVVDAWINSPSHRDNMLHPAFRHIGIGIDGTLWVLHFGVIEVQD